MSLHSSSHGEKGDFVRPTNDSAIPQVATAPGAAPPAYHVATQTGVLKVEAVQRVWYVWWSLHLLLGPRLTRYLTRLQGTQVQDCSLGRSRHHQLYVEFCLLAAGPQNSHWTLLPQTSTRSTEPPSGR